MCLTGRLAATCVYCFFSFFSGECTNKPRKPSIDGRLCKSFLALNLRKSCFVNRLYLYVFLSRNHLLIRFTFFIVIVPPNHKNCFWNTVCFGKHFWPQICILNSKKRKSRNSEIAHASNVARCLCYGTRSSVTNTTPQKLVLHCAGTISVASHLHVLFAYDPCYWVGGSPFWFEKFRIRCPDLP